ncbi:hypothetical protein [Pollutimonas bauzanensis]|uniref:hypothetical protein n=1 Tax=Pollutimonas bauzanensis TaxID=658167 RepID=UPI0011605425|nr:hypothetical protein [Pollutimonas bauzanensis]
MPISIVTLLPVAKYGPPLTGFTEYPKCGHLEAAQPLKTEWPADDTRDASGSAFPFHFTHAVQPGPYTGDACRLPTIWIPVKSFATLNALRVDT